MVNASFTWDLGIDLGAGCLFKLHQNTANWGSYSEGRGGGTLFHAGGAGCPYISRRMLRRVQNDRIHDFPSGGMPLGLGAHPSTSPARVPAVRTPYSGNKSTRKRLGDFPGSMVCKNSAANAGTRLRSLIQGAPTRCRATKPVSRNHGAQLWSRELQREAATAMRSPGATAAEWPPLRATRESPSAAVKTQRSQK